MLLLLFKLVGSHPLDTVWQTHILAAVPGRSDTSVGYSDYRMGTLSTLLVACILSRLRKHSGSRFRSSLSTQ